MSIIVFSQKLDSLFPFHFLRAQVTFSKVTVKLKLENVQRNIPQLTQACFLLMFLRVNAQYFVLY